MASLLKARRMHGPKYKGETRGAEECSMVRDKEKRQLAMRIEEGEISRKDEGEKAKIFAYGYLKRGIGFSLICDCALL